MFGRKRRQESQAEAPKRSLCLVYAPRMTDDAGVLADDSRDYIFTEVLRKMSAARGQSFPDEALREPDKAVNFFIRNYNAVLALVDHEGSQIFYSANYRNKLPVVFTDRVRRELNISPDSEILWASDVYVTPRPASAREVIWGQKLSVPKETRAQKKQKWEHPEALTPEELDYLTGKSKKPPQT